MSFLQRELRFSWNNSSFWRSGEVNTGENLVQMMHNASRSKLASLLSRYISDNRAGIFRRLWRKFWRGESSIELVENFSDSLLIELPNIDDSRLSTNPREDKIDVIFREAISSINQTLHSENLRSDGKWIRFRIIQHVSWYKIKKIIDDLKISWWERSGSANRVAKQNLIAVADEINERIKARIDLAKKESVEMHVENPRTEAERLLPDDNYYQTGVCYKTGNSIDDPLGTTLPVESSTHAALFYHNNNYVPPMSPIPARQNGVWPTSPLLFDTDNNSDEEKHGDEPAVRPRF